MGPHVARVVVVASLATVRAAGTGGGRGKGGGGGGGRGKATGGGTKGKGNHGGSAGGAGGGTATKKKASGGSDVAKKKQSKQDKRDEQQPPQPPPQQQQTAVRDPPVNKKILEGKFDALVFDDSSKGTDVFAMDAPHVPANATTLEDRLYFERKGHACIRNVLTQDEARSMAVALIRETRTRTLLAYKHRVSVLCPPGAVDLNAIKTEEEAMAAIARYSDEEVGFLQTFNIHRDNYVAGEDDSSNDDSSRTAVSGDSTSDGIKECAGYIMSRRLARIAAELLGADESEGDRVRLYQSCVFVKPPGFGETNWHSDANMVPLDTNRFVTLWLPLRPLQEDDAALVFASGSHRDFALPYWHTLEGMEDLESRGAFNPYFSYFRMGNWTDDVVFHLCLQDTTSSRTSRWTSETSPHTPGGACTGPRRSPRTRRRGTR